MRVKVTDTDYADFLPISLEPDVDGLIGFRLMYGVLQSRDRRLGERMPSRSRPASKATARFSGIAEGTSGVHGDRDPTASA
jgi:hypothetical protein